MYYLYKNEGKNLGTWICLSMPKIPPKDTKQADNTGAWLWAVAQVRSLAWELLQTAGLDKKKKKRKKD